VLSGGRAAIPNPEFRISNSNESGYTLVMFIIVIAVMAIMMAAAVEIVSFQMQREREAELIFRGEQYVEAIRLYRIKYGRYPMQMKELWEADPRVLRRKWKDPITDSDRWGLVYLGQEGQQVGGPGTPRQGPLGATPARATRTPSFGDQDQSPGRPGPGGQGERMGPIIGVHSLSTEASIKVYKGRSTYNEWKFIFQEDEDARGSGQGQAPNEDPWGSPPTPIPPRPQRTGTPTY
jgi:type II secretory pathway pseudopilin PulG